jgi:hypothetical protein
MKKITFIILAVALVILLSTCKYNGEATITVYNQGTIDAHVEVDRAITVVAAGANEVFELSWPGKGEQYINVLTYPYRHPELGENQTLIVKNGDNISLTVAYTLNDIQ